MYCTIHINTNPTYPHKYNVPCVVYGIDGQAVDVPSSVYDFTEAYKIVNEKIQLQTDLDLNGHALTQNSSNLFVVKTVN